MVSSASTSTDVSTLAKVDAAWQPVEVEDEAWKKSLPVDPQSGASSLNVTEVRFSCPA